MTDHIPDDVMRLAHDLYAKMQRRHNVAETARAILTDRASTRREALEEDDLAKILFLADWPLMKPDDWDMRGAKDHARVRYLMLAAAVIRALQEK